MIYIFRQYDSDKQIIIYAESYIEAKETLFDFNPWADKTYNIFEYKIFNIDTDRFWEILNLDADDNGYGYPRIISKEEFEILKDNNIILDKQFNDIHNTRVLMKKDAADKFPLLSTEEFVNQLKNNADNISKHKENIKQMLYVVGDIWVQEFFVEGNGFNRNKFYIYGKSRYQCKKTLEQLEDKFEDRIRSYDKPELLIEYDFGNDLTPHSIKKYDDMIEFMKMQNIKSFPFNTFIKEEES